MNFEELWNNLKTSPWLYLIILALLALIIFLTVRNGHKKKLLNRINDGQVKINDLKSHPFVVDIAKTDAIARVNSNIRDTVTQCKKDFDQIQINLKEIVSNLQDANEYLTASKFKLCEEKLDLNDELIAETDKLTANLDGVLDGILNQSTMQRKRINELKNEFHEIKSVINENPNNYTFCWEALDRITNGISHKFSDFESVMDASKYDEAAQTAEDIAKSIESLNSLVQKLPEMIAMSRNELPKKLNDVANTFKLLNQQGAYLEHLNVKGNIENISNSLNQAMARIRDCDLDGVQDYLFDCDTKINQLASNLEDEKNAHRDLIRCQMDSKEALETISEILNKVKMNSLADFDRYRLDELNKSFEEVQTKYQDNLKAYQSLLEAQDSGSIPATTLIITFKEVQKDIDECLAQCKNIARSLSSTRTNEMRVQELLSRFVVVLNESKATIKLSKLPNISKKYDDDITRAENYITDINNQLQQESLDITHLNETITDAQKLIVNLYKNVNSLISTAQDIENFIISCNKYRPYYPEVDATLYSAELAYRNGEYTKACKLAINGLESVDPTLAERLSKSINDKLAGQKEA